MAGANFSKNFFFFFLFCFNGKKNEYFVLTVLLINNLSTGYDFFLNHGLVKRPFLRQQSVDKNISQLNA